IITEVKDCKKAEAGQKVTANPIFHCGVCSECQTGQINHCTEVEVLGVVNKNGAYAEELLLPESMIELLPDKLSYEQGAMLEATAVAVRAVEEAGITPGSHVAIFGAGNIGLLVLQVAQAYGAGEILIIDPIESRLRVAEELGAQIMMTPDELRVQKSNFCNVFNAVIDGVSIEETISFGIEISNMGANIVVYGVPKPDLTGIPLLDLFKKDMKLITSRLYPRSFKKAVELMERGMIKVEPMITHRVQLNDFSNLLSRINSGQEKAIKIIVKVKE
ncbi:zinc-binding dehydrogenase, partial [Candidatus Latescibacterota bacterium]